MRVTLRTLFALVVLSTLSFLVIFSIEAERENVKMQSVIRKNTQLVDFSHYTTAKSFDTLKEMESYAQANHLNLYQEYTVGLDKNYAYVSLNEDAKNVLSGLHYRTITEPDGKLISASNGYILKPLSELKKDVGYVSMLEVQGSDVQRQDFADHFGVSLTNLTSMTSNILFLSMQLILLALCVLLLGIVFVFHYFSFFKAVNTQLLLGEKKQNILARQLSPAFAGLLAVTGIASIVLLIIKPALSQVLIVFWPILLIMLVFGFGFTLILLRRYQVSKDILNGKAPLRTLLRVNRALTIFVALVTLLFVFFFSNITGRQLKQIRSLEKTQLLLQDYTRSNLVKPPQGTDMAIDNANKFLYQMADNGSIVYVAPDSREDDPVFKREIWINPNYLAKFPIVDQKGKKVQVSEGTSAMVELIPISRENQTDKIIAAIQEDNQSTNFQSTMDSQGKIHHSLQKIKVLYYKAWDKSLRNIYGNTVSLPYFRVLTKSNTDPTSFYGSDIMGPSTNLYKKVAKYQEGPVYNNDPNHFVDGLTKGHTASDEMSNRIWGEFRTTFPLLVVFLMSVLIYLFCCYFGFTIYIKINGQSIFTKSLLGQKRMSLYSSYFIGHFVFAILGFVISLIIGNIGVLIAFLIWLGFLASWLYWVVNRKLERTVDAN